VTDAELAASVVKEQLRELAEAMRAVGAGRATLGRLTLDLSVAPLPVEVPRPALVPRAPETEEEAAERRSKIMFRSTGGKKVRLR
jgi:hypothetical protein